MVIWWCYELPSVMALVLNMMMMIVVVVAQVMDNLKLETEIQRELSCMCLRSLGSVDISLATNNHKNQVQEFFLLMAICNTVVVSLHPHEDIVRIYALFSHFTILGLPCQKLNSSNLT